MHTSIVYIMIVLLWEGYRNAFTEIRSNIFRIQAANGEKGLGCHPSLQWLGQGHEKIFKAQKLGSRSFLEKYCLDFQQDKQGILGMLEESTNLR